MTRSIQLTPEIERLIVAAIRGGAYPHIAAEAAGVPRELFQEWLQRGEQHRRPRYRAFANEVRQARAHARLKVELEVHKDDPKFWLLSGPGKDSLDPPGWSSATKPLLPGDDAALDLWNSPEWAQMWTLILQILSDYPEARSALVQAVSQRQTHR